MKLSAMLPCPSLATPPPAVIVTMLLVVGRAPVQCSEPCTVEALRDDAFFTTHDSEVLTTPLLLILSPSSTRGDDGMSEESLLLVLLPIIPHVRDEMHKAIFLYNFPFP